MDFRYINVLERDLDNSRSRVQLYSFLDKIPPDVYQQMMEAIKEENLTLKDFTVCLSESNGSNVLKLNRHRGRGKGIFGILELELRGAFIDYYDETIVLNKNFLPVVHLVLDDYAVSLHDTDFVKDLTIKEISKFIKRNTKGKKIIIQDENVEDYQYFPNVTRYFTKKKDVEDFYDELVSDELIKNIVTTPVTYEDVFSDMENSDILK